MGHDSVVSKSQQECQKRRNNRPSDSLSRVLRGQKRVSVISHPLLHIETPDLQCFEAKWPQSGDNGQKMRVYCVMKAVLQPNRMYGEESHARHIGRHG